MYRLLFALLFTTLYINAFPQQVTNWKNYTDMKNAADVKASSNGFWAATSGGGFFYNNSDRTFTTLNKVDGINSISLSAVAVDNEGKVWFGSSDGTISIYDPSNKSIKTILDIFNSGRASNGINDMSVSGDTIIISHDFGVSLVDANNMVFYDTFIKFGNLSSNIKVNSAFKSNLFYVGTLYGLAIQKQGATNLSAPESWNVYNISNGLPSNNVLKVVRFDTSLIAATDNGLAVFNGTSWSPYLSQFIGVSINDLMVSGDSLIILTNNAIFSYKNNNVTQLASSPDQLLKLGLSSSLGIIAASNKGIFVPSEPAGSQYIFPNGPGENLFPSITVDGNGNLWSASGKNNIGVGFYKYDGSKWTTYNTTNTPALKTNDCYTIYSAPDNTIYIGTWGAGFTKLSGDQFTSYDTTGTGMVGIAIDGNFLVITGFAVDVSNNLWLLNYESGVGKALTVLTSDNKWINISVPSEAGITLNQHYNLVIDQYGTKWYNVLDSRRAGLYYYNENGTLTNSNDDIYGYITSANGLNNNNINCLAIDKLGNLWVGTSPGANIITNLSTVSSSGISSSNITPVYILSQQTVNCIAVDALNQKWIGTNEGLLLVNSDGSSLLATYNTTNSPLLSNQITSLAIDQNTGTVYAGSNSGIVSFKTDAEKPLDSFNELFFYPNPFKIKNSNNQLTIEGLVKDSNIKILTISGRLVRQFTSPGGRVAYWDGRDDSGNLVASGIYLIVAYDTEGNNVTAGKVAVLRQ
jgi:ligand-binding sensor domain-containing protein